MTYRLTKLAADGTDFPADATGHLAVRLDHSLLAAPLIWTAHRAAAQMTWAEAKAWAESLGTNGWSWRLPTVEEAFLLPDRSRASFPLVDPAFFPDCDGEWIWTGTPCAGSSGYAWYVDLDDGGSASDLQGYRLHVRAVRSGQGEKRE